MNNSLNYIEERPWGTFKVLEEGKGFKVKLITVNPGKRLSLQSHNHRDEHWVVVCGEVQIEIDDQVLVKNAGEHVFIKREQKHRLSNPGSKVVHLIETQIGEYLEEDDIIRYDDDFGREDS